MCFGIFVLNRVSILSIFVLNRVSFLRQEPITLFLDDKQPALMFYECLKLGIKNRNSVLNRVGKSAIFVLNRVRVWGAEPHLPTQGHIEYPPGQNADVQFTKEIEENGKIPFLDFLVTRDNNKLKPTIYRKPTHTDRLLDQSSYNPTSTTIRTLTRRA